MIESWLLNIKLKTIHAYSGGWVQVQRWWGNVITLAMTFDCHWKSMECWVLMIKIKLFVATIMHQYFFLENLQFFIFFFTKYLQGARHSSTMAPTSPQSEFPLNNILIWHLFPNHHWQGMSYLPNGILWVELYPWEPNMHFRKLCPQRAMCLILWKIQW